MVIAESWLACRQGFLWLNRFKGAERAMATPCTNNNDNITSETLQSSQLGFNDGTMASIDALSHDMS